jgi:hypothetical protein
LNSSRGRILRCRSAVAPAILCACAATSIGQTKVTVTIDEAKTVNVLTTASIGVYAQIGDANWMNRQVLPLLRVAGITSVRYPDGWDGQADLYHWSAHKAVKWGNSNPPRQVGFPAGTDFGHFAQFAEALGTAMITVNYGSDLAGALGADPHEAAAWVAYANGDPAGTTAIGTDSSGIDWKTAGYWASMRAASPLSADDGYNFLRIAHPKPFNLRLWEVGNEVYNNGWFGGDHATETDLHAPYPASEKENDKRRKNPSLSPAFYGARLEDFSRAMKAVDPTILIGASLGMPFADPNSPDSYDWGGEWDSGVLKAACQSIDFVSLHWHPGNTQAPDWKNLDEGVTLSVNSDQLNRTVTELLGLYKKDCPAGRVPKIAFTEVSPVPWAKLQTPVVNALFAADTYALLIESGSINSDWFQLHENSLLSDDNKPLPAYYGLQMLHIVAYQPGDQFVAAASSSPSLAVHATRRRDGLYGLMLVNKDPKTAAQVKVTLNNAQAAAGGPRFDYGPEQSKAGAPPVKTMASGLDKSFTVDVPPYSIVDLLIPKAAQ